MSLSFADLPAAKSSGLSFDDLPDKNPLSFDDLPDAKRPSFGNVQSGASASPSFGNVQAGAATKNQNVGFLDTPVSELPGAALTGLEKGGAELGKYAGLAAGGAAGLFDDVAGTHAQDAIFKNIVQPEDEAAQYYDKQLAKMGLASQVVGGVTNAVPDLVLGAATMGESLAPEAAATVYQGVKQLVGQSVKMAAPLAVKAGGDAYGQAIADGKAPWEATTSALHAIGSTEAMGMAGGAAEGSLMARVAQSGAATAGTGEAIRELEGRDFSPTEFGTNLAIGLGFGIAGHDNATHTPTEVRPGDTIRVPTDAFQDIPNKSETVNVPPGGFSPDAGKTSSPENTGNAVPQKTESKISPDDLDQRKWHKAIADNPDASVDELVQKAKEIPDSDVLGTPSRSVDTSVGPVQVDQNSDVPYLGGSNGKGTVYLDKDFNPIKDIGGKQVDVTPYLAEHEAVEAHLEDQGWSYTDAHEQATKYEHQKLRDDGIDPAEYETALKGDLKNTFSKPDAKPPSDIIEKPYDHPHTVEQRKVLDEVQGNEAQQPPQEGAHPLFDDLVPKEVGTANAEVAAPAKKPEVGEWQYDLDTGQNKRVYTAKDLDKAVEQSNAPREILKDYHEGTLTTGKLLDGMANDTSGRVEDSHKTLAKYLLAAGKRFGGLDVGIGRYNGSDPVHAAEKAPANMPQGYYHPFSNAIRLGSDAPNQHLMLHETVHALTNRATVRGARGLLDGQAQHAYDGLNALFQGFKNHLQSTGEVFMKKNSKGEDVINHYGFHNVDEYLAEFFSNPKFRDVLKNTKLDSITTASAGGAGRRALGVVRNMYTATVRGIRNMLGLPEKAETALHASFAAAHQFLGNLAPEHLGDLRSLGLKPAEMAGEAPISKAQIDAQAKAAIAKGADPDAVQKRVEALYKEHGHDSEQGRDNGPAPTSTKNAVRDAERAAEGRDPIIKAASRAHPETMRLAREKVAQNPDYPAEVIHKLNEDGVHSINAVDEGVLLDEKVRLRNARDEASKTLSDPNASEEAKAVAQVKFTEHEAAINLMDQATEGSGSEWGRFGAFRSQMMKADYSLDAMESRMRGAKGGPLSPEEAATVKEDAARVKDAQNELDRTQNGLADKGQVKATYDNLVKEMAQQLKTAKKKGNFLETLKKNADESRDWFKKNLGQLNSGVDPTAFYHLARIGAYHIANGAVKFKDWVVRMKAELGSHFSKVEDAMPAVFKAAKSQHDLGATETKPRMKAKADLDPNKITHKDVYDLARAHIINGVHGEDAVMKAVHGDLAQHGLSERDVRRLFSEYGEVKFPSKEADKTELRELRSLVQMQESIDRLHEGLAALKSGPQRDKATQVVREKRRQLNDLLKAHESKNGMSPEKLATFQEARARNLRNQIEDLQKEIATGEKKVRKAAPADNEEVASLKKERDALREQLKAIEAAKQPPRDLDQEARDRKVASIEKEVADLERRIKERDFSEKEKSKPVTSPRIEELRQQRDALKKQYDLYKPLPPTEHGPVDIRQVRADAEKSRLTKRIAELQDKIAKRDVSEPGKVKPLRPDAELVGLRKEKAQLEKDLENMKPGPAPTRPKNIHEIRNDQRRKALAKQIEKLTAELNGEIAQKSKPSPDDAATAAMKQQRDKLREQLRAAEAARNPPPSPEEKYQANRAKSIKQQMEAIYKRIENNDYAVRTKPDHELNKANKEAAYKLYQAKNLFARHQFEMQMSQRAPLSKLWGGIKEAQNLGRAIMTSVDLSATLRQGGFVALGHPIRAAHALAASVHAMKSERNAYAIQRDIETRPNFELYKRAGLDLTLSSGHALGKQEEQFMSRWVEHTDPQHNQPIRNALRTVKNAALAPVRGSERAFKTFINKLRADSFDTMLAAFAKDGSKPTKEELKAIANYINVATGRGRIGKNNAGASGLSTVFFAPRLVASRFNLLAGQPLYGGSAKTRTMILGEYARYLAGVGVVMGLGQMSWNAWGNKKEKFLELDPRSANFMKMHFGNTYIDPLSGLGQVTTFVARELAGENKNQRGEIVPLRPDFKFTNLFRKKADMSGPRFGQSTGWDVAGRFARTKFAPVPGMFIDIASGTNVVGQPVSMSNEAVNLLTPMSLQQVQSVMQEHGIPAGTAMTLLDLLGMSVQQRTPYKKTPKPVPPPEQ